jgi:hypothetical protein
LNNRLTRHLILDLNFILSLPVLKYNKLIWKISEGVLLDAYVLALISILRIFQNSMNLHTKDTFLVNLVIQNADIVMTWIT